VHLTHCRITNRLVFVVLKFVVKKLTYKITDPCFQFEWLKKVLTQARASNEQIMILGHVPPGYFERAVNMTWFYPYFNKIYHSIVRENCDIIVGQVFAHQHSDSVRGSL